MLIQLINDKWRGAIYLMYLSGNQALVGNYAQQTTTPSSCLFWDDLCWLRCTDYNSDGLISQSEFDALFQTLDSNGDNTLDDEAELPGLFEKKL